MRKEREALLVAALAGLVIVGAAAFVVQPASSSTRPAPPSLVIGQAVAAPVGPATTV